MSTPVWAADIAIDAALASKLIAAQFPALGAADVTPFAVGWDNAAFLVDGTTVFRFPRRRIAVALIEREAALLPLLAPQLPVHISAPAFIGKPSAEYPWPFAGYPLIAGRSAGATALSNQTRIALAEPLAGFLRSLHALDPAPVVSRGLPPDEIGRSDHERNLGRTRERLATLADAGYGDQAARLHAWLQEHPPRALGDGQRRVVHGDLYARHVVLDERGRLAGVIDWGDIHLGDPALDLSIAHAVLPPAAHRAFRDTYGPIDEASWNAARYRAIYSAIVVLDYGIRERDPEMIESGSAALRLVDEAPA